MFTPYQMKSKEIKQGFIRKIESNNDGLSITEYSFNGLDSLYNPIREEYTINITNRGDAAADMFYFNPLFFEQVRRNPFRLEERKYPIDYSYPRTEVYQLSLEIPEGYEVEEMPLPVKILLPENSASFEYSISSKDNKLVLINKISINKPVFISEEYPYLKEFYNKIVEKHAEPVIVKKSL